MYNVRESTLEKHGSILAAWMVYTTCNIDTNIGRKKEKNEENE
jgi:hypothetical protein